MPRFIPDRRTPVVRQETASGIGAVKNFSETNLLGLVGKGSIVIDGRTMAGKNVLFRKLLKKAIDGGSKWKRIVIIASTQFTSDFDFMEDKKFLSRSGVGRKENLIRIPVSEISKLSDIIEETGKLLLEARKKDMRIHHSCTKNRQKVKRDTKTMIILNDIMGYIDTSRSTSPLNAFSAIIRQFGWLQVVLSQCLDSTVGKSFLRNTGMFILHSYKDQVIQKILANSDVRIDNKEEAKEHVRKCRNWILLINYWTKTDEVPEEAILIQSLNVKMDNK